MRLTIFTSKELDGVTEVTRQAAVENTHACRDPAVRPQTSCVSSHLSVAMARRRLLAELRQRRTEQ